MALFSYHGGKRCFKNKLIMEPSLDMVAHINNQKLFHSIILLIHFIVVLSLARMELENFFKSVMPVADYFDQSDMLVTVSSIDLKML